MTEDKAKTKLCPHRIFVSEVNDGMAHDFEHCLASDCMMWKWEDELLLSSAERISDHDEGHCGKVNNGN